MKCLFIGGSADGQMRHTESKPASIDVPVLPNKPLVRCMDPLDYPMTQSYETEVYYRKGIIVGRTLIEYYALADLTELDAIAMLFKAYADTAQVRGWARGLQA